MSMLDRLCTALCLGCLEKRQNPYSDQWTNMCNHWLVAGILQPIYNNFAMAQLYPNWCSEFLVRRGDYRRRDASIEREDGQL